jgi:hypothetical protein
MRKSSDVPIALLAAFALLTAACHEPETRNCVDAQGRIVPDADCQNQSPGVPVYHFVYGGSSGGHFGDTVIGGSTTPSDAGIFRGGFGHGGSGGDAGE